MSTEKKIQDFLHYYIGADCWVQGQIEEKPIKLTGISWDDQTGLWWCYFENTETSYAVIEDVALLLSKLEDITDDQWIEIENELDIFPEATGMNMVKDNFLLDKDENRMGWRLINEALNELRKRGVDCDGLIEAGLAVDKKTVKP